LTRTERSVLSYFGALVVGLALFGTEPSGDCGEYLLTARAFAAHATPDIRAEDVDWVATNEPRLARVVAPMVPGIPRAEPVLLGSIFRSPAGSYYSFHFWLYSLLGAPFLWLTTLLGAAPVVALGMVNAGSVWLAGAYAHRRLSSGWLQRSAPFAFLVAGTTYYLGWTGPETLTASSALIAVFAAMSGDLGLAVLAAGLAAAQNPSAAALVPFALAAWTLLRLRPVLALLPGATALPLDRRAALLASCGLILVALPYVFFWATFGEPSLIRKYATDAALISGARAWSLLFDLNQGMLVGVPGVLVGLLVALSLLVRKHSVAVLVWTTGMLGLMGALIVPTLASHNWNSGASVMMRYAYWAAAPLLGLLLALLARLPRSKGVAVGSTALVAQVALLFVNGLWGGRSSYTQHGWAARLVLRSFPGAYNPIPEIFHERTVGREEAPRPGLVVEWPQKGRPRKILAFSDGPVHSRKLCAGRAVTSRNVVSVPGGARYLNPPLRCTSR
jgi:hypothetical protein